MAKLQNIFPGEILLEEFLVPMEIGQNWLARYFGTSEALWMGLQADYDLEQARESLGGRLAREVRSCAACLIDLM